MTTREQAYIYMQEQPDDILIVGKIKREPNPFFQQFTDTRSEQDKRLDAMTEQEKDQANLKYLSQFNL